MTESDRRARNESRLAECFPSFRERLRATLADLEAAGFRPRIQDAWRSPQAQAEAFAAGRSKLRFGLHNCTGPGGEKEALAADVLDDDFPVNPRAEFLISLARVAGLRGLETGIAWGLPPWLRLAVQHAIVTAGTVDGLKIGWDPCHVQVVGILASAARNGARPK